MKCNYCGGNLSLEDEVCPHCGKFNRDAAQHIQNMRHYQGEFEEAKEEVYTTTRRYSEVAGRVILLAILLALICVGFLAGVFYHTLSGIIQGTITRAKAESYSVILDDYIENEEYQDLYVFAKEKKIYYETFSYSEYENVLNAARNYSHACVEIMKFAETESKDITSEAESLAGYLGGFYKAADAEWNTWMGEEEEREKSEETLEDMKEKIRLLLVTYCGLTEEEAVEMETMSAARCAILLEEGVKRNE